MNGYCFERNILFGIFILSLVKCLPGLGNLSGVSGRKGDGGDSKAPKQEPGLTGLSGLEEMPGLYGLQRNRMKETLDKILGFPGATGSGGMSPGLQGFRDTLTGSKRRGFTGSPRLKGMSGLPDLHGLKDLKNDIVDGMKHIELTGRPRLEGMPGLPGLQGLKETRGGIGLSGEMCEDNLHECPNGYCCKIDGVWECCILGDCLCENEIGDIFIITFAVTVVLAGLIGFAVYYKCSKDESPGVDKAGLVK